MHFYRRGTMLYAHQKHIAWRPQVLCLSGMSRVDATVLDTKQWIAYHEASAARQPAGKGQTAPVGPAWREEF